MTLRRTLSQREDEDEVGELGAARAEVSLGPRPCKLMWWVFLKSKMPSVCL